jgi:hypothetical protein
MPVPNSSVDTSGAGGETSVGTRISLKNSPDGPRRTLESSRYVKQQITYTGPNAGAINLVTPSAGGDITLAVWSPSRKKWEVKQESNFFDGGLNKIERVDLQKKLNNDPATKNALRKDLDKTTDKSLTQAQQDKLFPKTSAAKPENSPSGGPNAAGGAAATAGGPAGGAAGANATTFTEAENSALKGQISKSTGARTAYNKTTYRYPFSGADQNSNDYIQFQMVRYVPNDKLSVFGVSGGENGTTFTGGLSTDLNDATTRQAASSQTLATICLPVPGNMQDSNPVNWASADLTALEAYGAQAAAGLMGSDNPFKAAGSVVKDVGNKLKDPTSGTAIHAVVTAKLLQGLTGKNLLTRSTGAIINPNSELLFTGPSLRSFQFSYRMTPRYEREAEEIKRIIRIFKQGSSVKKAANGIFLASPNVFKISPKFVKNKIQNGKIVGLEAVDHPFLNKFKLCALNNIAVNYTPDGSYMTYANGSMISYEVVLSFSELDPIFDDDYTDTPEKGMGDNEESPSYSIGY